ncbi:MAG: hypothetical protein KVP17_003374 [Porospora cf. gigantea B]|uniref:uncharacterized protein n=1 Tax=Porospora cf. gigantea B TaxID=2853592 RepID=UPI003571EF89|nr:MAG: hypothetical protein KVP17_003374 [Porospora cf. gigantea B]
MLREIARGGAHVVMVCGFFPGRVVKIPQRPDPQMTHIQLDFLHTVVGCRRGDDVVLDDSGVRVTTQHRVAETASPMMPAEYLTTVGVCSVPLKLAQELVSVPTTRLGDIRCILEDDLIARWYNTGVEVSYCTVELKVKGGLPVAVGSLASRFELMQKLRLAEGEIAELSHFDPVRWFSACFADDVAELKRCLKQLAVTPQRNLRMFLGGQPAPIGSGDPLIPSLVAEVCQTERALFICLQQYHAHAEGQQELAPKFLQAIRRRTGAPLQTSPEMYAFLTMRRLRLAACGIRACALTSMEASRELQKRVHLEGACLLALFEADGPLTPTEWETGLLWLCRFLLGRTMMDCSVMVNLVKCSRRESDRWKELQAQRFREFPKVKGLLYRVSIVDVDLKPIEKIPQWKTQFYRAIKHLT